MDAEGIREIARMQCVIDSNEYFLSHLYLKLMNPNKEIICIECDNKMGQIIWEEVDKLQNIVNNYERKTSTTNRE